MASITLGQLLQQGGSILNNLVSGNHGAATQAKAASLLKKSPLEVADSQPDGHMLANPLGFSNIQFPRDLGKDGGHYMMFYTVANKDSLDLDNEFNNSIGIKNKIYSSKNEYTQIGDGGPGPRSRYKVDTVNTYNIKKLRDKRGGQEVEIGQPVNTLGNHIHTTVTSAIALYMPPGIKAEYSVENGPSDLGLAGLAFKTFRDTVGASGSQGQITAFLKGISGFAEDAARKLAVGVADTLLGDADTAGAITKVTGRASNPFTEVVFKRVNNRNFTYTFNLMARNKDEVQDIDKIIKVFKYHMHPELDNSRGGRYFKVPSEFEIFYAYNDQTNNYLNKISRCVLTNCTVDYNGDKFSTFRNFDGQGAAPTHTTLTLAFTETEIMTKNKIMEGF